MSGHPGMSNDELIAALRKDMAATSAERDKQKSAAAASEKQRALAADQRRLAEEEVDRLEAEAKAASTPDAQIRAGLRAIRQKFADLFS